MAMRNLAVAVLVTASAAIAAAQTPAPAPATISNPKDAAAARQAASRKNVQDATQDKGYTQRAGEAASKAATTKDMPNVTPDAASKREAVSSATKDIGYTQRAGEAAAAAKKSKAPKPAVPKPRAGTPELNKVVP